MGSSSRRDNSRVVRLAAVLSGLVMVLVACTPPPNDAGSPPTTLQPLPDPPSEFSLLSYNVAGLPQGISGSNPERNLPLISPLLNDYDVVLTQEDFDWWQPIAGVLDFVNYHARLRAQATHPYRSAVHPGPAAVGVDPAARPLLVGDGIGFLSRYPLLDERHVAWEGCFGGVLPPGAGDCLAMKGFRVMTMVLGDGREVDVYNLHAEAGGTAEDQALQVEDYEQLAEAIETWSAGRAVIVAGDTNLHVDPEHEDSGNGADAVIWARFLDRMGLTDVCAELDCPEWANIDKAAYRSGGGIELSAVDHEFVTERFRTPEGEDLSDHPPLAVVFGWDVAAPN
jgi:hypothetical protein